MSDRKKLTKRIVITALILLALAAAVFLIARTMHSQTVDVFRVDQVAETYWGDSQELSGTVTEGSVENIPLSEGMVQEFKVKQGDEVKKGDVLFVYDTSSYQLTLSSDQAQIAMLKSQISSAQQDIASYRRMTPSEAVTPPPPPTPRPAPNTVAVVEDNTPAAEQADGVKYYNCTTATVVRSAMLQSLRASAGSAGFRLYSGRDLLGLWLVSGADLAADYTDDWTPADWKLGEGLTLNGDGTISMDLEATHYGVFESRLPGADDPEPEPWEDPTSGYSSAEIAEMIREKNADIKDFQRQLQKAELKYKRDQLTSRSGEVKAADDGVVTYVGDPHVVAVGETLVTLKGSANAIVTVYVDEFSLDTLQPGDEVSVTSYETGASFLAKVDKVSTEPDQDYSSDPNNSMYPVICISEDPDVELNVGEWCSVMPVQEADAPSDAIYIPMFFIRDDEQGSYVLAVGENGRLERRAVSTGKVIWGSSMEIRSGVTLEDELAFPYGRSARPGNRTRSAEIDALYGGY